MAFGVSKRLKKILGLASEEEYGAGGGEAGFAPDNAADFQAQPIGSEARVLRGRDPKTNVPDWVRHPAAPQTEHTDPFVTEEPRQEDIDETVREGQGGGGAPTGYTGETLTGGHRFGAVDTGKVVHPTFPELVNRPQNAQETMKNRLAGKRSSSTS